MSTKDKILELFEAKKGTYFSGEDLAHRFSVSRSAVWKAVKALQNDGYKIDAVTNKGYCLSVDTDILSPQGIKKYLDDSYKNIEIDVLQTIDSTNTYIKQRVNSKLCDGYTVIAAEQTGGLGRKGRTFYSPKDSGIYLSIYLKPKNYSAQKAVRITTMAGVAMCETIKELSPKEPKIKWVNDIFIDGKKVSGILTQASFDLESSSVEYAILGLGINVYAPTDGFPDEIKDIAGYIFDKPQEDMKNKLAASFINHFMEIYKRDNDNSYIQKYKDYSFVIGKKVTIISSTSQREAKVLSINDECQLVVEFDNGLTETISSGEISLKV